MLSNGRPSKRPQQPHQQQQQAKASRLFALLLRLLMQEHWLGDRQRRGIRALLRLPHLPHSWRRADSIILTVLIGSCSSGLHSSDRVSRDCCNCSGVQWKNRVALCAAHQS